MYQMPSRTCHTKQGPLRAVLQKEQRVSSRQKAEARQTKDAREQACCRRAKGTFRTSTGAVILSHVLPGGMMGLIPGDLSGVPGIRSLYEVQRVRP